MMLKDILRESSVRHKHICPRQVLGARMSLYAGELLNLKLPSANKRLLVISETDGCTVDGVMAATGCHVGGRTLRILDFGKVAATFTDTFTGDSIRIVPASKARTAAIGYAPHARNKWQAMLFGYQAMPAAELFVVQPVELDLHLSQILSCPGMKTTCQICHEEIINGREVTNNGIVRCRTCAGEGYYHTSVQLQFPQEETALIHE